MCVWVVMPTPAEPNQKSLKLCRENEHMGHRLRQEAGRHARAGV